MIILGVLGQKGGSGKTTIAVALAVEAARATGSVLLVDADEQASATAWGRRRGEDGALHVVQSGAAGLAKLLELAAGRGIRVAIVDMAGRAARELVAMAGQCTLVVVPVRPAAGDIETLPVVRDMLRRAGDPLALLVVNAAPTRGNRAQEARDVLASVGLPVWRGAIGNRVVHADAMNAGRAAVELDRHGLAGVEVFQLYQYIMRSVSPPARRRGRPRKDTMANG